jgi:hypothetical protein
VIALAPPNPLVLTGSCAVRAHHLVNRSSQDLDDAIENPAPMADMAATLRAGLECRGRQLHALATALLSARFTVTDPATEQACEVDLPEEEFWRPVAQNLYGPVLAEEDVIGTKVRFLADRRAARGIRPPPCPRPLESEDRQANLAGAEWTDGQAFAAYGLDDATISRSPRRHGSAHQARR